MKLPQVEEARIPSSTYRLQLRKDFNFRAATDLVDYLDALGIGTMYLSPLATARPGSVHGYDVVDPAVPNPELGTREALDGLLDKAHGAGLTVLLDVVPNHLCIAGDHNAAWKDVLENGPSAASAKVFDIDWDPPKDELKGKVLLPFLGDQYGRLIEDGLAVGYADGGFYVAFADTRLPLGPRSWLHLLRPILEALREDLGREDLVTLELESIIRALEHLPLRTDTDPDHVMERRHEREAVRRRLRLLFQSSEARTSSVVERALSAALALFNAHGVGEAESARLARLEALMDEQGYRLAHWRVAAHEVNYRRFFDVNELGAIRVEEAEVFDMVHALPLDLARHPAVCGFRIDHVDGLADPTAYLDTVARRFPPAKDGGGGARRPYLVVEKILADGEALPWPALCHGTTGYEFIPLLAQLFVDARGLALLHEQPGCVPFSETAYLCKRLVLESTLAAELTVLSRGLDKISEQHRHTRDFTLDSLQLALGAVLSCFPLYRTYLRESDSEPGERDAKVIQQALREAKRRHGQIHASVFDFIGSVLLQDEPAGLSPAFQADRRRFISRFQQLSGPVMAKAVEDTAFYRQLPLFALAEVGCTPDCVTGGDDGREIVHRGLAARQTALANGLMATTTHDTKRSEDLRARLYGLAEVAPAYVSQVEQWKSRHRELKRLLPDGAIAPHPSEENLFYESVVGLWPLAATDLDQWDESISERLLAFMRKARAEAKLMTSWINPNRDYEAAADQFFADLLDSRLPHGRVFLGEARAMAARVAWPGLWTSLSQLVVKLTAPGVPDFYQGCERLDFSLVDPDNRRLVDHPGGRAALRAIKAGLESMGSAFVDELVGRAGDGHLKMMVTHLGLRLRRRHTILRNGGYFPIVSRGPQSERVFAFARTTLPGAQPLILSVVGRRYCGLPPIPIRDAWAGTTLDLAASLPGVAAGAQFREALTGRNLGWSEAQDLSTVLSHLPVAILERVK